MPIRAAKCIFIVFLLFLEACAPHRPLLVRDQSELIKKRNSQLRPYSEVVQQRIKASNSAAALVISDVGPDRPPTIIPTQDPLAAAVEHLPDLNTHATCFFVFERSLAIPPEEMSCSVLAAYANEIIENRKSQLEQKAALKTLGARVDEIGDNLRDLRDQASSLSTQLRDEQRLIEQSSKAISNNRTDIDGLGNILGPTVGLVNFHEAQLKSLEKMLQLLITQYQKAADVIGTNNNQIDSLIKDINASFVQIKTSLDQIQQKLSTIK